MNSSFLSIENESHNASAGNEDFENDSFLISQQECEAEDFMLLPDEFPDFNLRESVVAVPLHSTPVKRAVRNEAINESSTAYLSSKSFDATLSSVLLGESGNDLSSDLSFSVIPAAEDHSVTDLSPVTKKGRFLTSDCFPPCCSNCCLDNIDIKPQKSLVSKNIIEQNQFLMDSFNLMSNKDNGIQHMIAGKAVCKNAFIVYFKISNQRYERIFKQFTENPTLKIQRKPVIRSDSTKVTEAKAWIARYFKRIGDSMPHVEQTHLPHGLTKQDVYLTMKQELSQQGVMSTISLSHFYAIWDTSFSNVLIPKVNMCVT